MAEEAVKNGDAHDVSKTVSFSAFKPQMFVEEGKVGDAVHFYKAAFGAQEVNHVTQTKRKADQELPLVVSAELKLGSTIFLVSDLSDHSSAMLAFISLSLSLTFTLPLPLSLLSLSLIEVYLLIHVFARMIC